jgi:Family of unknown function (DUF6339)
MSPLNTSWHVPEHIGLLPGAATQRHLTGEVRRGEAFPPVNAVDAATVAWNDPGRAEAKPLRDLIGEVFSRFDAQDRTRADAWLAPRLHATLRITRAEAADPGLWNFLTMRLAPDYVQWRHQPRPARGDNPASVAASRYSGPFHTQTFSRLWWVAELFRDGADYAPAIAACGNQDMLNSVLRLEIIHHRPTAQAFVAMLQNGTVRTGRAVNAAGSTLSYEALAPDYQPDYDAYRAWVEEAAIVPPVSFSRTPDGPSDGSVDLDQVDVLVPLFTRLFDPATVRGRIFGGDG